MLLEKIFKTAKETNCKKVRWQVLNWNKGAIKMYEKYNIGIDNEWLDCSFDQKNIKTFQK